MPILKTKLYRPRVPEDFVPRPRLVEILEECRSLPLTLVSAPAGYGKTTLVSSWLETSGGASAWLSLDEGDSDLRLFLGYLVAALRTISPKVCKETHAMLNAQDLPAPKVLAEILGNDLDRIKKPFILALDDYHRIREPSVHELIDRLLEHPPRSLHLVVMTRRDPALSLYALRGQHLMTEVRVQDLQFSRPETALFLERALGSSLDGPSLDRLQEGMEGWPVALRLASLAMRHGEDVNQLLRKAPGDLRQIQTYLVTEILSNLSTPVRDCLCRLSILDRFCPSLPEALYAGAEEEGESLLPVDFHDLLLGSGLLCIPLDERQEWYRYHHLFQQLLRSQLEEQLSKGEIALLHDRASTWFDKHHLVEEALRHALEAGKPAKAGEIIARRREEVTAREEWPRLARWLNLLPPEIVEKDPDLLILQAKSAHKAGRYTEWGQLQDRVESLLTEEPRESGDHDRLLGEILSMRGMLFYHLNQVDSAKENAERALRLLPPESVNARALAVLAASTSRQMLGDLQGAYEVIDEAQQGEAANSPTFRGRLLQTRGFLQWMTADLQPMTQTASAMEKLGRTHGLQDTIVFACYFQGAARYHLNDLDIAAGSLAPVADNFYGPTRFVHVMCVHALSLIHMARGRPDSARELSDTLAVRLLEAGNTMLLPYAQALQAELALRQGRQAEALQWAQEFKASETPPGYHFSLPELTAVKVFLRSGTKAGLGQAGERLATLHDFFESTHNRRHLIETLALQAMLSEAQGEKTQAVDLLGRAVSLAQRGGFIRLFVDLGPELGTLLNRLALDEEGLRYVGRILSAFRSGSQGDGEETTERKGAAATTASWRDLVEPLSGRELEVLGLMSKRLTNAVIAEKLHISPGTVKRHTENIYGKLAVHNRWEAVAKAQGLGFLRA